MIFKNNNHTKNYLNEYVKLLEDDSGLITDKYNDLNRNREFKDNCHDQSIFSLLTKPWWGHFA